MKKITLNDIQNMSKIYRLNLINSVTGYKPANLIATKNENANLAIFSSIVHLGSNPPLLGHIQRPIIETSHTYKNIKATGFYTINALSIQHAQKAHQTSAKYDADENEFEKCGFTEEYKDQFPAPFVQECQLQLAMKFIEEIPIIINNTKLIIGEIQAIYLNEKCLLEDGNLQLDLIDCAAISGLYSYNSAKLEKMFQYAKKN